MSGEAVTLSVNLTLPSEVIEEIAQRAAEIAVERLRTEPQGPKPVLLYGAKAAAEYLGMKSAKMVNNRLDRIPYDKDGDRLVFETAKLDEWASR